AIAALPEAGRRSPRRVLRAVAAAVAGHVLAETETCRVLMEARALAAHQPAIAAAVRAPGGRTPQPPGGPFAARGPGRGGAAGPGSGAGRRVVHRRPVRADGPVAPGTGLVLLAGRGGRARRRPPGRLPSR